MQNKFRFKQINIRRKIKSISFKHIIHALQSELTYIFQTFKSENIVQIPYWESELQTTKNEK